MRREPTQNIYNRGLSILTLPTRAFSIPSITDLITAPNLILLNRKYKKKVIAALPINKLRFTLTFIALIRIILVKAGLNVMSQGYPTIELENDLSP